VEHTFPLCGFLLRFLLVLCSLLSRVTCTVERVGKVLVQVQGNKGILRSTTYCNRVRVLEYRSGGNPYLVGTCSSCTVLEYSTAIRVRGTLKYFR
jgi:hypothetical protein